MTSIEITGRIDEHNQLQLDNPLPVSGPMRVKVIVLYSTDEEIEEAAWIQAAKNNTAFDFLNDASEDIYSLSDGVAFRDEV